MMLAKGGTDSTLLLFLGIAPLFELGILVLPSIWDNWSLFGRVFYLIFPSLKYLYVQIFIQRPLPLAVLSGSRLSSKCLHVGNVGGAALLVNKKFGSIWLDLMELPQKKEKKAI
ncbi:uncharacterized protein DS421_20g686170 [Arachis hypogaea]|nr:uncharacterized protein DS421_20g686170 [Arachis hypogaea]